jgi:hypothetical protein
VVARVFLALALPAPMGAFTGVWLVWQVEDFLLANNWLDEARTNWQQIVWAAAGTGVAVGLGQTAIWLRARLRAGHMIGGALDCVLLACAVAMLPCLWWPREPLVTIVAATWAAGLVATVVLAGRTSRTEPVSPRRAADKTSLGCREEALPEAEAEESAVRRKRTGPNP